MSPQLQEKSPKEAGIWKAVGSGGFRLCKLTAEYLVVGLASLLVSKAINLEEELDLE